MDFIGPDSTARGKIISTTTDPIKGLIIQSEQLTRIQGGGLYLQGGDLSLASPYNILLSGSARPNGTFGITGYNVLTNGLYLQWVRRTNSTSHNLSGNWPIAFPNACLGAAVSKGNPSATYESATTAASVSYTSAGYYVDVNDSNRTFFIIAIGY